MTKWIGVVAALVGIAAGVSGCHSKEQPPMKKGDNVCIGRNFYIVGDMATYPWVKMDPNERCQEHADVPPTFMNLSKVETFEPNCVCRYSAACRKKCLREVDTDSCLATCTD